MATDDVDLERWVDDRLASIAPAEAWDPSVPRGLERLHRSQDRAGRRRIVWMAAATAAALLFVPMPVLRALAQDCGAIIARFAATVRPPMPEVALRGANGGPMTVSALRGRVVLLSFWPDACAQCG